MVIYEGTIDLIKKGLRREVVVIFLVAPIFEGTIDLIYEGIATQKRQKLLFSLLPLEGTIDLT